MLRVLQRILTEREVKAREVLIPGESRVLGLLLLM